MRLVLVKNSGRDFYFIEPGDEDDEVCEEEHPWSLAGWELWIDSRGDDFLEEEEKESGWEIR